MMARDITLIDLVTAYTGRERSGERRQGRPSKQPGLRKFLETTFPKNDFPDGVPDKLRCPRSELLDDIDKFDHKALGRVSLSTLREAIDQFNRDRRLGRV
jgi:hypothetical protein